MTIEELMDLDISELTEILNSLPDQTLEELSNEVNKRFWELHAEIRAKLDRKNSE